MLAMIPKSGLTSASTSKTIDVELAPPMWCSAKVNRVFTPGLCEAQPSNFGSLPTNYVESPIPGRALVHPNSSSGLHHVVLMVPEFEQGRSALTEAGVVVSPGKVFGSADKQLLRAAPMMGDFELELIGPEKEDGSRRWDLWGLVIAVEDIDVTAELLGGLLGR